MKKILAMCVLVLAVVSSQGAVLWWSGDATGGNENYANGSSWTENHSTAYGAMPATGDEYGLVTGSDGASVMPRISSNIGANVPSIVGVGWDATDAQLTVASGGYLQAEQFILSANAGKGTLEVETGGTLYATSYIQLGGGTVGTINIADGGIVWTGLLVNNSGSINLDNGGQFWLAGDQTSLNLQNTTVLATGAGDSIQQVYNSGNDRTEYTVVSVLSILGPPDVVAVTNTAANTATNVAIFTPVTTLSTSVVNDWSGSPTEFPAGDTTIIWTAIGSDSSEVYSTQTVSVVVEPALTGEVLAATGTPRLTVDGGVAAAVRIESSDDLQTWTVRDKAVDLTAGQVQWEDDSMAGVTSRFYRAVQLTPLDTYGITPSDTNSYTLKATYPGSGETTYIYEMISQNWLTTDEVDLPLWKHWLTIIVPDTMTHTTALLSITGGDVGAPVPLATDGGHGLFRGIAIRTQSIVAELRMVPQEPVTFAGEGASRTEDGIMAYAWDKFLDHGDPKWIPRRPMSKAAVVAMDSITAIDNRVEKFVVTGASKRGWTTWATAIVDDRVEAIIPVVIDLLNLTPFLKHSWKCTGEWAPALGDYKDAEILDRLDTPEWDALVAISDPFAYRDRLTMPKFIINSANDEFYFPDSSQFYFDELKGVKYLSYAPNAGHGEPPWEKVEAYHHAVINSSPLPQFTWRQDGDETIEVTTTTAPSSVVLWQAAGHNNTRDFKIYLSGTGYTASTLTDQGGGVYRGTVSTPATGYKAYFIEMNYNSLDGGKPFKFTTDVKVVPDTYPPGNSWPPGS